MNNNYTKKLVTEILNQTTYDFPNMWMIMVSCETSYLILIVTSNPRHGSHIRMIYDDKG
jgi:hypothetical protein